MDQVNCSISGCDRLASMAQDSNGDLCGDHRDAESALGRESAPTHEAILQAANDCLPVSVEGLVRHLQSLPAVAQREFVATKRESGWDGAAKRASLFCDVPVVGPYCEYVNGETRSVA